MLEQTVKNLLVEKVSEKRMAKLRDYHSKLSQVYGVRVGLAQDKSKETGVIKSALNIVRERNETQQVNFRGTLLSFLRAKDDNMILLMAGLLFQVQQNPTIW